MSEQEDNKQADDETVAPPQPDDETVKSPSHTAASNAESRTSRPAGGGGIAIVLALLAIGIASYPAYITWQDTQQTGPDPLAAKLESVSERQQKLDAGIALLGRRVDGLSGAGESYTDEKIEALRLQLRAELQLLRDQFGTSSQDWLFAEVEYLIRMANQRALMERDVASALKLLQSADAIIRDAEGLTAHALREALAMDIAELKAANQPDVQGIFLELSALIAQVARLERNLPTFEIPVQVESQPDPAATWYDRLLGVISDAGTRLSELVDFRRGDVEIKPILPPGEEYYLRQNLILKLQLAQLALLDGDNEVFRTSISEARAWVADNFDDESTVAGAMIQTLSALSQADVRPEVPDISDSLAAVRRQLQDFKGETTR